MFVFSNVLECITVFQKSVSPFATLLNFMRARAPAGVFMFFERSKYPKGMLKTNQKKPARRLAG
jgi:hypothetical protein